MAGSDASEGQAVWQPGGAEEDSRLREGDRHLHLAYDDEEEEEVRTSGSDGNPFETDTKGRLFVTDVSVNWPSNRNWQTKEPDPWKVT